MPNYAIVRVNKIRSRGDLAGASLHGARADGGTHYDTSRTHLNQHWLAGKKVDTAVDWCEAVDTIIMQTGAAVRANGAVAAELFLSVSAAFFEAADETWDEDVITNWADTTLAALNDRYPRMIAAARLDLDEATPHLSVCVVPIYTKTTKHTTSRVVSFRKVFGGAVKEEASERLKELQDWYASVLSPFGVHRGIPKSNKSREYVKHAEYEGRRRREDEARRKALAEAEAARDQANLRAAQAVQAFRRARHLLAMAERDARDWLEIAQGLDPASPLQEYIQGLRRRQKQIEDLARDAAILAEEATPAAGLRM